MNDFEVFANLLKVQNGCQIVTSISLLSIIVCTLLSRHGILTKEKENGFIYCII